MNVCNYCHIEECSGRNKEHNVNECTGMEPNSTMLIARCKELEAENSRLDKANANLDSLLASAIKCTDKAEAENSDLHCENAALTKSIEDLKAQGHTLAEIITKDNNSRAEEDIEVQACISKMNKENAELRKRLELKIHYPEPTVFWKDGMYAYANGNYIGRISIAAQNTWSISCVPTDEKEWLGEFSTKEKAQDEFIKRWHKFWQKIHGEVKK